MSKIGPIVFGALFVLGFVPHAQTGQECSLATRQGDYGFVASGNLAGVGPSVAAGRYTADGKGNFAGSFTQSLNGVIARMTFTGTYTVNPDCTGTETVNIEGGPTFHNDAVIVDGGREIRAVNTDPGNVVSFHSQKQSSQRRGEKDE